MARLFADKANDYILALNTMQLAISGLEGDPEDQLHHIKRLSDQMAPLAQYLAQIEAIEHQCTEANIEENDFTTHTYDDLSYEFSLIKSSVNNKLAFLENQCIAREMTNLTPIQLEEFESVFRHFDRDSTNTLSELEFSAALASLGLVFSEDEMHDYFLQATTSIDERAPPKRRSPDDRVSFEQFIRFMVEVTEDQNTAEQVFQSFKEVADGKPYVTEIDLRHSLVGDDVLERMAEMLPEHNGVELKEDRGVRKYDYVGFMEKLLCPEDGEENEDAATKRSNMSPAEPEHHGLREAVNGGNRGPNISHSKVQAIH